MLRSLPAALLGASLLSSCASAPPKDPFPPREQVASLADAAPPAIRSEERFSARAWTLEGPLPAGAGHSPRPASADPLEGRLQRWAPAVTSTEELHCAAREIGRVLALEGRYPAERLRRFLLGACGSPTSSVGFASFAGEVPADVEDAELLDEWGGDLEEMVKKVGLAAQHVAGLALVREGGRAAAVLVYTRREVDLEPVSLTSGASGAVLVEGEVLRPTQMVQVWVNRGAYGVERCELDPAVRAPRFSAHCPVDAADETAWISVSAYPPERMIGTSVLDVLARPAGTEPLEYRRRAYAEPTPRPDSSAELARAFVELLNGVRRKAGAGPLTYVDEQSALAEKLSGHLAASLQSRDEETTERIMLGMLAGWEVNDAVVDGQVAWSRASDVDDVADLVGAALEWPSGRATLLEPAYDLVALGALSLDEGRDVTLFVGSWDRFDGHSIEEDSERARASLNAARARWDEPVGVMPRIDGRTLALAREIDEGGSASDAMDTLLQEAVTQYRHNMNAWVLYPRTLDDIVWPQELLRSPQLFVSLAVAVERHPSVAWSRKVILVVAHFPQGPTYAERGEGPRSARLDAAPATERAER